MPYHYILANLLSETKNALGTLFLDDSGEPVDLACAAEISPFQMRVLGAYLGIRLRQQQKVLENNELGEAKLLHLELAALHVYAIPLPDEYFLVLVQRPPAVVAAARRHLIDAAQLLVRELFAVE
jgi:hypothetical protein